MKDIAKFSYKSHPYFNDYLITKSGEVYSTLSGKFLKQKIRKDGYREVSLRKNGSNNSCLVHRLVIETFYGIPSDYDKRYTVCNHKDGDRSNNRIDNLEWTTQKDNCSEEKSKQKEISQKLRGHNVCKCTEEGIIIDTYPSVREAARQNSTGDSTLLRALKLGTKSKGYYWRYE